MNWYKGDIASAVAESRKKNAIFVVFISGNDAASEKLLNIIETDKIRSQLESEHFIAIRIQSDSQSYMQFASIYQMAPVPSIFFIGSTGTPIEIGTSIMNTADELDEKIKRALQAHLPKTQSTATSSAASSAFIAAEQKTGDAVAKEATSAETQNTTAINSTESDEKAKASADTEIVCDGDVCYRKPKETTKKEEEVNVEKNDVEAVTAAEGAVTDNAANQTAASASAPTPDFDARLAATRELLAHKRREALEEEKKQEKERELRRRREGKEIQHMQEWQREKELKDLKANIRRERTEEQQARERIRAQIAADRAERAQRSAEPVAPKEPTPKSAAAAATNHGAAADTVRLQFRFLNGEAKVHTFGKHDTISDVRNFVSTELLAGTGYNDFTLATVYPRHEFATEDDEKTLLELGLFPSAVILVITKESTTPASIIKSHGGIVNIFSTLIWSVLSPIFSVFNYLRGTLFNRGGNNAAAANASATETSGAQKRANEDSQVHADAAKRRNLERFMTGPSTSRDARLNTQADDLTADHNNEQKPYRRYGASNVHRLSDKRKDSDDENATWNGNSTQQQ